MKKQHTSTLVIYLLFVLGDLILSSVHATVTILPSSYYTAHAGAYGYAPDLYPYAQDVTMVDIPNAGTGTYNHQLTGGLNANHNVDRSGNNLGSIATANTNLAVAMGGGNSLQVSGSSSGQVISDSKLVAFGSGTYSDSAAGAGSSLTIKFRISDTTEDASLSGLFSAFGGMINPLGIPGSTNGSSSYTLSSGNRILSQGSSVSNTLSLAGVSVSNSFSYSNRLAPGDYSLTMSSSVGAQNYSGPYATSPISASANVTNFMFALTPGPALSGSVTTGSFQVGISGGGNGTPGGTQVEFTQVSTAGNFSGYYQVVTDMELNGSRPELYSGGFNFTLAGDSIQFWDLDFDGNHLGKSTLLFNYDPTLLAEGVSESDLAIAHFVNGAWILETGIVDEVANTITIQVDNFSPFTLTTNIPEPTSLILTLLASGTLLLRRKRG